LTQAEYCKELNLWKLVFDADGKRWLAVVEDGKASVLLLCEKTPDL
jgi:hypothetical protein